jgi:hypothetical protein
MNDEFIMNENAYGNSHEPSTNNTIISNLAKPIKINSNKQTRSKFKSIFEQDNNNIQSSENGNTSDNINTEESDDVIIHIDCINSNREFSVTSLDRKLKKIHNKISLKSGEKEIVL